MPRRRGLLLTALVILACRQPAEQREGSLQSNLESPSAAAEPVAAEPAAAPPAAAEPAPTPVEPPPADPTPSESCNEIERLAASACAQVEPERCGTPSKTCACKIVQEEYHKLNPCEPRGFARLRVEGEARSVYLRDGAIWIGSDALLDFDSVQGVLDPADSDATLFAFEEHQSYDDDYGTYELWAVAQMLCAVIDEQPRCSKPIMQNYVLSDSTEERRKRPISLEYAAELEFTEDGLTVAVERDADRQRAQKEVPTARLFRAGDYTYEEVVDRPLKRL